MSAKIIDCVITPSHFNIGLKGNPPFINEDFHSLVIEDESHWYVSDNVIEVNLQKALQGETWPCALKGHGALNPVNEEKIKKEMMLERFQRENPVSSNKSIIYLIIIILHPFLHIKTPPLINSSFQKGF